MEEIETVCVSLETEVIRIYVHLKILLISPQSKITHQIKL